MGEILKLLRENNAMLKEKYYFSLSDMKKMMI